MTFTDEINNADSFLGLGKKGKARREEKRTGRKERKTERRNYKKEKRATRLDTRRARGERIRSKNDVRMLNAENGIESNDSIGSIAKSVAGTAGTIIGGFLGRGGGGGGADGGAERLSDTLSPQEQESPSAMARIAGGTSQKADVDNGGSGTTGFVPAAQADEEAKKKNKQLYMVGGITIAVLVVIFIAFKLSNKSKK